MTSPTSWIKTFNPQPNAYLRLLCLPYVGAGASVYRAWSNAMPPEVEVCALQLPGRESRRREAPLTDLPRLVSEIVAALDTLSERPLVLFGHSLGALIAFELARELRHARGLLPIHLLVAGQAAPQLPVSDVIIHTLPDDAFIRRLREYNGTSEEILHHEEMLRLLLPALRADFALCERYNYRNEPPLDTPISVLSGSDDQEVSRESLLAWASQTTQAFRMHVLPGDHFFVHQARASLLALVAQELGALLPVVSPPGT